MPALRITTGSRLHFGLLSPAPDFGGIGLMVKRPGLEIEFWPAELWSVEGPHSARIRAQILDLNLPTKIGALQPQRIAVRSAPKEHVGLGTGTQLTLAIAQGLLLANGRTALPAEELAQLTGRGRRSGVGLHGFEQGGFLFDGGKRDGHQVPRLIERDAFPDEWRFLLIIPKDESGRHGANEEAAFGPRVMPDKSLLDDLASLVYCDIVPSIRRKRFEAFAEALFDYNREAGAYFREVQGGMYSSPWISEQIDKRRSLGVAGVGQSSWGPTLFAACGSEDEALALMERLRVDPDFIGREMIVTAGRNEGMSWAACV